MSLEVFKWCPLRNPNPTIDYDERVKEVRFGDGYEQVSPDGINSMYRTFKGFTYSEHADAVLDFYRRHGRSKAFILDIPGHRAKVRFSGSVVTTEKGNGNRLVTVEMREVF